jgi:tryptophan synthase alpha chain
MTANRIDMAFGRLQAMGRKGLIPFLAAGDPSLAQTAALVRELETWGADIVELGVPFSDPLADGPINQRAYQRGLKAGATVPRILDLVAEVRRFSDVPIVLMSYLNPIHRFGLDRFPKAAHDAGVDGLILCDAPPEETELFRRELNEAGLHLIQLVAPTTPPRRIAWIGQRAGGYLYYVSLRGVTGPRARLPEDLAAGVQRVRAATRMPVAVGFGISTPAQAAAAAELADAVIVGSALVAVIERSAGAADLVSRAGAFLAELRSALSGR